MWGKGRKFRNNKIEHAGFRFDSKLEKAVFEILKLQERANEISELKHHPGTVFLTDARIQYRPDFRFKSHPSGDMVYAEAKGYPDSKWAIKKKLWLFYGPAQLIIYGGTWHNPQIIEIITPRNMK